MARRDPWADIVDFEGGNTQRSQAPASRPTPVPTQQAQPMPQPQGGGVFMEETSVVAEEPQGPRVAGGALAGDLGFYNQSAMDANSRPPNSDAYQEAMWKGLQDGSIRTPEQANQLAAKFGLQIPDQEALARAFAPGTTITGVSPAEYPTRPVAELRQNAVLPEQADAFARGVAGTFGIDDEIDAIVTTAMRGGDLRQNLQNSRAIRDYDEESNFWPRLTGEITGGVVSGAGLPSRVAEAGQVAARLALRQGLGREAALQAARRAVVLQSAREGGALGFVAGAGEADGNIADRALGGLGGLATGATIGGAFGDVGARFAQRGMQRPQLSAAQEVGQAAENIGMELLPADVGGPMVGRITAGTVQTPFGVGPLTRASIRILDRGRDVLNEQAALVGQVAEPEAMGDAARRGAMTYIRRSASRIGRIYDTANELSRDARIPLNGAIRMLDEDIARLEQNPLAGRALEEARAMRASLEGDFTVQGIRDMRTDMFVSPELRGTPVERRMRRIVDAAAQDIEQGLRAQGLDNAANAFATADRQWRQRLKTIDRVLEPIIGKSGDDEIVATKSGEAIAAALDRSAKGNSLRLQRFLETIPPEEAGMVRATLIGRMGLAREGAQNAEGNAFSLSTFLTNWNKMSERARRSVFGDETRAALNDLATVAGASREAQRFANISNTGGANAVNLTSGSLGASVIAFLTGNLPAAGALASPAVIQAISGRLLASPRFARWLARAPRTQLSPPAYIDRLSRIARAEPAIAGDVLQLQRRLQEAFASPARVAADEAPDDGGGIVWDDSEQGEQEQQTGPTP